MNRYPLIAASLVLAIAGVAVWPGTPTDHRQAADPNKTRRAAPAQPNALAELALVKRQAVVVKSTSRAGDSIARLTVTSMEPTQQESCRRVEAEAHRALAKLSEAVSLSASQKPRVFEILVRGAAGFHPSMLVAGAPPGELADSPADAICEILSPAQEATFHEALLDDAAWWDDAIAQMEAGLAETAPAVSEPPLTDVGP